MFYLNMLDYTVFFPMLSTLTWDTLLTLRSTWGFYLNHLIPLRPIKSVFNNVLLEHGRLPHVLPLAVHLILLPEQVEVVILSHYYSLSLPSPSPLGLDWDLGWTVSIYDKIMTKLITGSMIERIHDSINDWIWDRPWHRTILIDRGTDRSSKEYKCYCWLHLQNPFILYCIL